MKNISKIIGLIVIVFAVQACEEIPPTITPVQISEGAEALTCATPDQQDRTALIEEFTGVKCVNCPAGSEELKSLLDNYAGQLVGISVHSGFFSKPITGDSQYDFRIPLEDGSTEYLGDLIENTVGPTGGYPAASINRTKFDGEQNAIVGVNTWNGYIAAELQNPTEVRLGLNSSHDDANNKLYAKICGEFIGGKPSTTHSITIFLTEDGIIDAQKDQSGTIDDYEHNHVLRAVFTPPLGASMTDAADETSTGMQADGSFSYAFELPVNSQWNLSNCHVVAFVHETGDRYNVLQAVEKSL